MAFRADFRLGEAEKHRPRSFSQAEGSGSGPHCGAGERRAVTAGQGRGGWSLWGRGEAVGHCGAGERQAVTMGRGRSGWSLRGRGEVGGHCGAGERWAGAVERAPRATGPQAGSRDCQSTDQT